MVKDYFKYYDRSRYHLGHEVDMHQNKIEPIENDWQEYELIPTLKNHLDIVTRNPGIFPTSEIVKMNPKLFTFFNKLPAYSQINEELIAPYYTPGSDMNLKRLAFKHRCHYMMSTSTVSGILTHIYYSLSNFKSPHFNNLSQAYDSEPLKFMVSQRKPNTVFLAQVEEGRDLWSIDGDSGFDEPGNVVLLKMGKYMEKMLTTEAEEFNNFYVLDMMTNKPKKNMTR